jgi:cellobiose phosphorylase
VPDAWREFAISYRYGSSAYAITVQNPRGLATGVVSVTVDGRASADGAIALADDGAHHDVVVRMG